jgi:ribose-phosphate pyrophosphokinase
MLIFSGGSNKPLAEKVAKELGLSLGKLEIITFPDNENRVRVIDRVLGEDVVVIQSTGIAPNLYYMELFFILDSLKRSGAKSITLAIPYLGYQRQDHIFRDGESVSLEVIIKLLENMGVTRVISFDFHSVKIPVLFNVPVTHLSALEIFAQHINKMDKTDLVLVSPDMGGIARIKKLSELTGGLPFASIEKNRDLNTGEIESDKMHGEVGKRVIIVDDVVSTGKTLIAAADLLRENGAEEVSVMATHAIFAKTAPEDLENSSITKICVTDTLRLPKRRTFPKLEILSVSHPLAQAIKNKE